ncbi:MAG: hypothetical protein HRF50_04000 [Phycisphaerae bacterium]|jgi:hypothetical protein
MALYLAVVAMLIIQQVPPQPPQPPCFTFSDSGFACGGCAEVNNCGVCSGGLCGAEQAQFCTAGKVAVPTQGDGFTRLRVRVNCFYKLRCVPPPGCNGACTLDGTPYGFSEATVEIDWPGVQCNIEH